MDEIPSSMAHGDKMSDMSSTEVVDRKLLKREKQLKALALKRAGKTYEEIAQEVGYSSRQGAQRAVKRLLDKFDLEASDDYRKVQVIRLEGMLASLQDKVEAGNERSIQTALMIMDRLDDKVGVQKLAVQQAEVHHTISIQVGDEDDYVKRLAAISPRQDQPIGELPEGMVPNPFMEDVVDAEVVE